MPTKADFERVFKYLLAEERDEGEPFLDVVAGLLYKMVGGHPGPNHRMPICCDAMRETMTLIGSNGRLEEVIRIQADCGDHRQGIS